MGSAGRKEYDFIVVGAGPSGCTIASRLARSETRPSVLLIEAGGPNDDTLLRNDTARFAIVIAHREIVWPYETVPQEHVNGRRLNYVRGKGLGGTSSINFCSWTVGPRGDYDEVARLVGDEDWKWENARELYRRMTRTHTPDFQPSVKRYLDLAEHHGKSGVLNIGYPGDWQENLPPQLNDFEDFGVPINPDHNSGDPIGVAVGAQTNHNDRRSTAADLLIDAPPNLEIMTDTEVKRIVFEDKTAVGVETDGTMLHAIKEVILSAGALDSPKLLMLSGIGQAARLRKFGMPVVHPVEGIGKGLKDHMIVRIAYRRGTGQAVQPNDTSDIQDEAHKYTLSQRYVTAPRREIGLSHGLGFLKCAKITQSSEFAALPPERQRHLGDPTVPNYEFVIDGAKPADEHELATLYVALLNIESSGEVTLQSSNHKEQALFDPKMLSHPYDRRVAIEGLREAMAFVDSPAFKQHASEAVEAPKSTSDEDLLGYWAERAASVYHMVGTVKMGRQGDEDACVDKAFKLLGVNKLRVVDTSVVPIMPANHTQTTAYLVGLMAGDKLVAEYGLDRA